MPRPPASLAPRPLHRCTAAGAAAREPARRLKPPAATTKPRYGLPARLRPVHGRRLRPGPTRARLSYWVRALRPTRQRLFQVSEPLFRVRRPAATRWRYFFDDGGEGRAESDSAQRIGWISEPRAWHLYPADESWPEPAASGCWVLRWVEIKAYIRYEIHSLIR